MLVSDEVDDELVLEAISFKDSMYNTLVFGESTASVLEPS
jgi:hypothetical protein